MRILFIGNSFTARNDVPGRAARLVSEEAGFEVHTRLIQRGGASLKMHWNKGEAAAAIQEGGWDWVVLQEQSTLPWKNRARFFEGVRLFHPTIEQSGARTVLYQTWPRLHLPETAEPLLSAYEAIAEETGALVVAVGRRWMEHISPELYDADGSHPSAAGSELAARCFADAILAENRG